MKIQKSTVGPIVGYTTDAQCRIFLRGDLAFTDDVPRRCFGAVRWRKKPAGKMGWKAGVKTVLNKLSPNFDFTGIFALDGLADSQEYEYQAGWFFADAELEKLEPLAGEFEWPDPGLPGNVMTFRTSSATATEMRTYALGSCRYLLRLFGGTWFDDRGDKVFRTILRQNEKQPLHGLVMVGDQIYADDLNFVSPDTKIDEFLKRYRIAFNQPNLRELMSQVPTYMILDDHEIEDNWPAEATDSDFKVLYPQAIHAYQIYQCSHAPLFEAKKGRIEGTLSRFWYTFRDGCSDWFVMDSRTERTKGEIISQSQLVELCNWLVTPNVGRVRFVVTSVPMFPDFSTDGDDKWQGYPDQRKQILDFISANGVQKVVFVSGDVHCSYVAQLTSSTDPAFKVHTIVSSSFFWPYPHTDQSKLKLGVPLLGANGAATPYVPELVQMTSVVKDDNFARVDVLPDKVSVSFYERKGDQQGPTVTFAP
jgi:alkaline phosphatase D